MLGLSVIILFNLIFNVNSNLAESSANCSGTQSANTQNTQIQVESCLLSAWSHLSELDPSSCHNL